MSQTTKRVQALERQRAEDASRPPARRHEVLSAEQALEVAQLATTQEPGYICVQSAAEIPAALAARGKRVRVYVGVCPDDWDADNEQSSSAPAQGA